MEARRSVGEKKSSITNLDSVKCDQDFYFPDGNVILVAGSCCTFCYVFYTFRVHSFKLREFQYFNDKLNENSSSSTIKLKDNPDDLHNTFQVVYRSLYSSLEAQFGCDVLVSTMRIATKYKNNELREFAFKKLDMRNVVDKPINYISWGREFNIPIWETRGINELALRTEPISLEEAMILGTKIFVELAARRETRLIERKERAGPNPFSSLSKMSVPATIVGKKTDLFDYGSLALATRVEKIPASKPNAQTARLDRSTISNMKPRMKRLRVPSPDDSDDD